jgi:hypothetical protein
MYQLVNQLAKAVKVIVLKNYEAQKLLPWMI